MIEDLEKCVEIRILGPDTLVKVLGILFMCHERYKQKQPKAPGPTIAIVAMLKCLVRHALQYLVSAGSLADKNGAKKRKNRRRRRRRRRCPEESSEDSELSESKRISSTK